MAKSPPSRMPQWYQTAALLQFLAPLIWGSGLWLIFLSIQISGSSCLTCFSQLGFTLGTSLGAITETVIGTIIFLAGLVVFICSIGLLASSNGVQAARWLRWMGRWSPEWTGQSQYSSSSDKYRSLVLASLALGLFAAILLIPGIGEDRQFPLNQFFTLWGAVWYFYVFSIGVFGWILVYRRVVGGYFLSLILSLIAVGMVVPDLFGLLPPAQPTLKTSIIFISQLPFSILCIYASIKALQVPF